MLSLVLTKIMHLIVIYYHRQIMCIGPTNADNRYHYKVVGDSPEFCRALDSHGFADLVICMAYHCSLSSVYPVDDPRRFHMGTPAQVWSTMTRCWQVEPTSDRIVEDIRALPEVLERIIAAKGCVVQDQFLRSGRRARRADDKGDCKNKPVSKQRISTLRARPLHPDCQEAFAMLTGDALANLNNNLDVQAEYIELIDAANAGTLDSDEPTLLHIDDADEFLN